MTAYAIGHLHSVQMGPAIVDYLHRIDETLAPFDGRFIIHGGVPDRLEGNWRGDLIVIEFPSLLHARKWYESPAYQAILDLRTANAAGDVFLIEGVGLDHKATEVLVGSSAEI